MYLSLNMVLLLCAVVAAVMYYVLGGDVSYLKSFNVLNRALTDTPGTTALKKMNHRETTSAQAADTKNGEGVQSFGYTDESIYFNNNNNTHHQEQREGDDANKNNNIMSAGSSTATTTSNAAHASGISQDVGWMHLNSRNSKNKDFF